MKKKIAAFGGALMASLLLGACQDKPSQPTATTEAAPTEAATPASDTTADTLKRMRAPSQPVPFVAPTKIGRILGDQSPSPPASRNR